MRVAILAALTALGCRAGPDAGNGDSDNLDTGGLEVRADIQAMAEAWCDYISCREGFYASDNESGEGFYRVEQCVDVYAAFWARFEGGCFSDTEEVAACTAALEAGTCPDPTPEVCDTLIQCTLR